MTMNFADGKNLLIETADIMDAAGIPFFLMQGTALGAYRDHGFTPTEEDIDFGVLFEDIKNRQKDLICRLIDADYQVDTYSLPFHQVRTIVAWKYKLHVDIVGFMKWKDKRFACSPRHPTVPKDYSIVHQASLLEQYRPIELFGRKFLIPKEIETYLLLEYGKDWKTPKLDHVSRTRVYDFVKNEKIPEGLLDA